MPPCELVDHHPADVVPVAHVLPTGVPETRDEQVERRGALASTEEPHDPATPPRRLPGLPRPRPPLPPRPLPRPPRRPPLRPRRLPRPPPPRARRTRATSSPSR